MVVKRLTTLLTVAVAILAKVGPKNFANKLASLSKSNEMSKQMININELFFPSDIKISNTKQTLIGGGLRSKWGFKVYSVGIYR